MNFKETDFLPVLLGNDINVYSLARSFYQTYGLKSKVFCKTVRSTCYFSKLVDMTEVPDFTQDKVFVKTLLDFAKLPENQGKKLLLMGCSDGYVKSITKNRDHLVEKFILPYGDHDTLVNYMNKTFFYKICEEKGIPYPKTLEVIQMDKEINPDFQPPYVLKPSNQVLYNSLHFPGQKKVYIVKTKEELQEIAQQVYKAGYNDILIIQEFIPGDDSYMRVLTSYSDQHGKVKMQCLGHVLLEEHTPQGIGNHAVILNEYQPELMEKMKNLLEELNFVGFSNMDIKFDQRDNQYKIFELNVRQGRSNYYVTGSGHNITQLVVDDYVYGKEIQEDIAQNEHLWMVIPEKVAFKYAPAYEKEMKKLIGEGKWVNPLFMDGDNHPARMLRLWKSQWAHYKKYKDRPTNYEI